MDKKIVFTWIIILYILLIMFIAIKPHLGTSLPKNADKVVHFVEFFILTLILSKTLSLYKVKNEIIVICIVTLIIAVISELIQINVPGRKFNLLDLRADILGIITALVIRWAFSKK